MIYLAIHLIKEARIHSSGENSVTTTICEGADNHPAVILPKPP